MTQPTPVNHAAAKMWTPGLDLSVANDSLSSSSDDIDFEKVYGEGGKRFVFFKATEAETYTDPQFVNLVTRASALPFRGLGAYGFQRVDLNAKDDLEHFLRVTDKVQKHLRLAPWFDLETREGKSAQQIVDFTCEWAEGHVRERGCGIVLYTYLAYLTDLIRELGGPTSPGAQALVQFPLALAAYTEKVLTVKPPLPWTQWAFLQWAASAPGGPIGWCPGVKTMVDLNWFYGKEDELDWLKSA